MQAASRIGLFILFVASVGGCDVLFPSPPESGTAELQRFSSQGELSDYFRDQIQTRNGGMPDIDRANELGAPTSPPSGGVAEDGDAAVAGPQAPSGGDDSYSGTTTQEQGVDEADVVKTDGQYVYMFDTRFDGTAVLRIVRASPLDAMEVASETELGGYGQDLYLQGGRVVAITSGGGYFYPIAVGGGGGIADGGVAVGEPRPEGDSDDAGETSGEAGGEDGAPPADAGIAIDEPFVGDFEYERPFTMVTIVDVSNPAAPVVASTMKFDGTPASSRMIEGHLHLVLANYQGYYYDVMPMLGRPELQPADVDVEELLPDYEMTAGDGTTAKGDLVTWENLYRPKDPDGFGVVTVVSIDTTNPAAPFGSVGIVAEPGLIYSSLSALYLTDTNYDYNGGQKTTTDIYKLAYDGASATPVAAGSVPGRILNQYSMGEYESRLRVATTIDPVFFEDGGVGSVTEPVNAVYVLEHAGEALSIVGRVENIAEGETIQSARFVGARGFLVTFEQIDPLFTMDLSDPANPRVVGELHVPGFSTYMTPMGENHVLAVGQFVPPPGEFGAWGVQLSIFDISDFANPKRTANVVIGGDNAGSYSEALWNPKAFTYFAEQNAVALPVSIYGNIFIEDRPSAIDDGAEVDADTGVSNGGGQVDAPPPTEPRGDEPVDVPADPIQPEYFEGLVVFRATPEAGFTELGRISTQFGDAGYYYPWFTRGVFIGQQIYAVTNIGVRVAPLAEVSNVQAELFYAEPLPPIITEPDGGSEMPGSTEPSAPDASDPVAGTPTR
jgi:uncharacterized secreted protein with C-terminal beta-propeller domain